MHSYICNMYWYCLPKPHVRFLTKLERSHNKRDLYQSQSEINKYKYRT